MTRRLSILFGTLVLAACLLAPAAASAAPALGVQMSHYEPATGTPGSTAIPAGTYVRYQIVVSNTGDVPTSSSEAVTVDLSLPAGLEVASVTAGKVIGSFGNTEWSCSTPDSQSVTCVGPSSFGFPAPIKEGQEACQNLGGTCRIVVVAKADPGLAAGTVTPSVGACGGGATPSCAPDVFDPTDIGPPARFDLFGFDGGVFDEAGEPVNQAGSHPHRGSTEFMLSTMVRPEGLEWAIEDLDDVVVDLPPGVVGNPQVLDTCTFAQLQGDRGAATNQECPSESQVGLVTILQSGNLLPAPGTPAAATFAVYNMEPPEGVAALFAFNVSGTMVSVSGEVRTGGDYGIRTLSLNAPIVLPLVGVEFEFWGVPSDPANDAQRTCPDSPLKGCSSTMPLEPFLSLPTSCNGPVTTEIAATGWMGGSARSSFVSHDNFGDPLPNANCAALDFKPTLKARPTTNLADSPSGLEVDLAVPQAGPCTAGPPVTCDPATAHLRDTTVTLPEGLVVNPSSANGLQACSIAQFGLTSPIGAAPITTTADAATCPSASKLGTVEVDTPLLDHPVPGAVYLAEPFDNPFDSLLALYIALDDPESGVVVKLAGKVEADPQTGQLTSTFENNPQLPFETLRLDFFGGARGSLRTPATCGTYSTTSSLTPWSAPESGPPATPSDAWAITQAPGGGACSTSQGALPNSPSFDAGTIAPIAGASSPMVINLRREDGSQQFSALNLTPPPGLVGKLAGIPYCSEAALGEAAAKSGRAEEASPSCPQASYLGSAVAAAGAGPAPYHAPGKAYLTGPYKGAPLSVAIVTPATAGPFDLGTVVVRSALHVDPKTAQITALSDPIPSILEGIPLDVRSIQVKLDRPDFVVNPTSCDPMAFGGRLLSTLGQSAALQSRFQVGECGRLGLKPRLSLRLKGGTKRGKYPALTAVLRPRAGDANLASISVTLPRSEFLAQEHIRTVCTRVQFAADQCPAAAVYGTATVTTPLLDYPLTGPVYLRSSDNELPDLVPDLRGPAWQPIRIESSGRTDSIRGGIRNTFDFVPDAAFTKLVLRMQGGKKGLLVNSRNICAGRNRATVKMGAHNGESFEARPLVRAAGCPKKAQKRKRRGR
ncbi:MAG TPA: hypothetical protein VFY04_03585 [Solirubrobacterales bacterium]|nr:hypothetical protein [Solirubrobacterales bacterium]